MTSRPASILLGSVSLAALLALSPARVAFSQISYPDFSSTVGLNLVGAAAQFGADLRLSPAAANSRGGTWLQAAQNVAGGFDTTFEFRISDPGGSLDTDGAAGGDGFAFVVQNDTDTALGPVNYMGYEIANSLAVEFDTWRNGNFLAQEPSGNHVGVQSNGLGLNDPFAGAFLGASAVTPNLSDGAVHTGRVSYSPGLLEVYVDDLVTPALSVSVDLSTLLNLNSGAAYIGFTAGGVTATQNHDLVSWEFASVPEPASLLLAAAALATAFRRRRF